MITVDERTSERREFAIVAGDYFSKNELKTTYTINSIVNGCLLAVRWGDGVVVVRVDHDEPVENHLNVI